MELEEARRLRPGMRIRCPVDLESQRRTVQVVELGETLQVDLFGETFFWLLVRDPQRGAAELVPSNTVTLDQGKCPLPPGSQKSEAAAPEDDAPSLFGWDDL